MAATVGSASAQVPAAQAQSPTAEQPGARFKSAVDLVSVVAVVRDRKGRFVPDLSQADFIVIESGQNRPIVGFKADADGPVRLAIVFDVSGSMRVGTKSAEAKAAARQLLSTLGRSDLAACFRSTPSSSGFATSPRTSRPWTRRSIGWTSPTVRRRCMTPSPKPPVRWRATPRRRGLSALRWSC